MCLSVSLSPGCVVGLFLFLSFSLSLSLSLSLCTHTHTHNLHGHDMEITAEGTRMNAAQRQPVRETRHDLHICVYVSSRA